MRRGGGKSKGANFEREICRRLSLWLSDGTQEDALWRSSMSGGRSTVAFKRGKRMAAQAGDISAVHEVGIPLISKFLIECKSYKDLNFIGLLKSKGKLVEFWKEVKLQANRYGKEPMLIAKQNQQPVIIALSVLGSGALKLSSSPIISAPYIGMQIYLFDYFLSEATPPK